jgi:hypothetical protein
VTVGLLARTDVTVAAWEMLLAPAEPDASSTTPLPSRISVAVSANPSPFIKKRGWISIERTIQFDACFFCLKLHNIRE